jgi:hypothetical protein
MPNCHCAFRTFEARASAKLIYPTNASAGKLAQSVEADDIDRNALRTTTQYDSLLY